MYSLLMLHVEPLLTVMVKFVRKDREGGGKLVYLYIVKIEDFHQILTAFLMHIKFSSQPPK